MHELSIAMSILDLVAEELEPREFGRVVSVRLKLGPLSGVVKEALQSAYELAARTRWLRIPGSSSTKRRFSPTVRPAQERPVVSPQMLCCAECGSPIERVTAGNELEIISLELET